MRRLDIGEHRARPGEHDGVGCGAKLNDGTMTHRRADANASRPSNRALVPELTATHARLDVRGELLLERRHLGALGEHAEAMTRVSASTSSVPTGYRWRVRPGLNAVNC